MEVVATATPAPAGSASLKPLPSGEDIDKCTGLVLAYAHARAHARTHARAHAHADAACTCAGRKPCSRRGRHLHRHRSTSKLDIDLALASARVVPLKDLVSFTRTLSTDDRSAPDWAVGGVLVSKGSASVYVPVAGRLRPLRVSTRRRPEGTLSAGGGSGGCRSKKGDTFLRWKVADLQGNAVTALLFDDAVKVHWKRQEGDVIVFHKPAVQRTEVRPSGDVPVSEGDRADPPPPSASRAVTARGLGSGKMASRCWFERRRQCWLPELPATLATAAGAWPPQVNPAASPSIGTERAGLASKACVLCS